MTAAEQVAPSGVGGALRFLLIAAIAFLTLVDLSPSRSSYPT